MDSPYGIRAMRHGQLRRCSQTIPSCVIFRAQISSSTCGSSKNTYIAESLSTYIAGNNSLRDEYALSARIVELYKGNQIL